MHCYLEAFKKYAVFNGRVRCKEYAVSLLIAFMMISSVSAGEYPRTFIAWKGSTPVLDGHLTPGEWDDAEFQTEVDLKDLAVRPGDYW